MNGSSNHEDVFPDLAGYALDALEEDARRRVEEHLVDCDDCTSELAELMEGAGNLAFAVPSVTPPDHLQDRIRAAIDAEPGQMSPGMVAPSEVSRTAEKVDAEATFGRPISRPVAEEPAPVVTVAPPTPIRRPWYASPRFAWGVSAAFAAAFAGVVAIGAIINVQLNDRVDGLSEQVVAQERNMTAVSASVSAMEQMTEATLTEVQQVSVLQEAADTLEQQVSDLRWLQYVTSTGDWLTPSFFSGGLQPQAPQGMLITHSSGDRALLMVNGLAPAPDGSVYQVWLIYDGREVPGSTFTVDRYGYAVVDLDLIGDATAYIGASITVELAGGAETPSDYVVLIGTSP